MQVEYRCSNHKCQRPADTKVTSRKITKSGVQLVDKEPVKKCAACGSEVKLLPV